MKKFLGFISAVVLLSVLSLSGCGSEINAGKPVEGLSFGKKYIAESCAFLNADEQTYYMFESNGTGKYKYYLSNDSVRDYTVSFVYSQTNDGALHCFFKSVEYGTKHSDSKNIESMPYRVLFYSTDVLYFKTTSGYQSVFTSVGRFVLESKIDYYLGKNK